MKALVRSSEATAEHSSYEQVVYKCASAISAEPTILLVGEVGVQVSQAEERLGELIDFLLFHTLAEFVSTMYSWSWSSRMQLTLPVVPTERPPGRL